MKYWILTTEFPPFYGGGISTYCRETADMMAENGHSVTVFIYDYSVEKIKESYSGGIRVIRFCPLLTDAHTFMGFTASLSYEYAEIIKLFVEKEGNPDILESQDYNGIAYFIQQFKWQGIEPFTHLKILITCHAPSFICLEYNQVPVYQFPGYWTGEMEKASIKSADLVIFPSTFLQQDMEKRISLKNVNNRVIPNPIKPHRKTAHPSGDKDENMIVCFGKLSPLKGSFELLTYFRKLWDNGSSLQLYFIGGTDYFFYPEMQTMYDLISKKYKPYIDKKLLFFTGNLPAEATHSYLLKAKLVVLPSLFDNLPYTVLEAMLSGTIVLASSHGGQAEIITHGYNGFLFDHKIENDFHRQLQNILELSPGQYDSIAQNGVSTVSNKYDPSIVYKKKNTIIEEYLRQIPGDYTYPFIHQLGEHGSDFRAADCQEKINLSIVIPYHNMGNYIEECLISVLGSLYKPDEILIINDGSTDPLSISKLEDLKNKYPVQIISTENQGLPATRNYGAANAKGRFIAFLDADDTVEKMYYGKAIDILTKYNNVHFVGCWLTYFGEGQGTWPAFNPEPPYILVHNMINSSGLVFKRNTFLEHGINKTDMIYGMEDWETVINLTKKGFRGVVIPLKFFNYRVRKGSMAQSFTREKQLYLYKLIGQKHRDFYGNFGSEIAQILHSNGPGMYFDNPTFEITVYIPSKRLSKYKNKLKQYVKRNNTIKRLAYFFYRKIKK
jgi:glycosyltransferase involved in cell wall biosynthesis